MKHKCLAIVMGIALLFLGGCTKDPKPTVWEGDVLVYYLDKEEVSLQEEWHILEKEKNTDQVAELLHKMQTPTNGEFVAAFPESVKLPTVFIGANGLATLLFDESYSTVTGTGEVLMRAAIVKTLCQLDGIDSVEFYVGGQPLMSAQNIPVGIMKETDFIDSTGTNTNYYQFLYAKVYYANAEGDALVASNLKIPYRGIETEAEIVLRQLIAGPVSEDTYPVIADNTKVLSVTTKDNVCVVDFSKQFLKKLPDVTEDVVIYSVVNTLAELPGIYQVQILVEGKQEKLYQKTEFLPLYERNLNVIEKE